MRYLLFLPIFFSSFYMSAMYTSMATSDYDMSTQTSLLATPNRVQAALLTKSKKTHLKWPPSAEVLLYKHHERYVLEADENKHYIRPELVSKQLRSVDPVKLAGLLKTGRAYVKIDQCDDGEFTMDLVPRCNGGGPGGAFAGGVIGVTIVKGGALLAGYAILYTVKGVIHITAGPEAAQAYDDHIVQVSIPHLRRVADTLGDIGIAAGTIGGGLSPLP